MNKKSLDWSLHSLFGRRIERSCPVAQTSQIFVSLPRDAVYSLKPNASSIDGDIAVFDVNQSMFRTFFPTIRTNRLSS